MICCWCQTPQFGGAGASRVEEGEVSRVAVGMEWHREGWPLPGGPLRSAVTVLKLCKLFPSVKNTSTLITWERKPSAGFGKMFRYLEVDVHGDF